MTTIRSNPLLNLAALITLLIASLFLTFAGTAASAAENDWKPSKEKNGIQTFTRKVEGSKYRAVKGSTVLAIPVAKLVAVINDAEACPEWADMCKTSSVYEQVSNTEAYVYTLNDLPWPVKDRDVVAHLKWHKSEDGTVRMHSVATSQSDTQQFEKKGGIVRIETATAHWEFKPLPSGETATTFEVHMDPNGQIPGWLLNRLVLNSPFTTFKSLSEQASKPKYDNASLPF